MFQSDDGARFRGSGAAKNRLLMKIPRSSPVSKQAKRLRTFFYPATPETISFNHVTVGGKIKNSKGASKDQGAEAPFQQ